VCCHVSWQIYANCRPANFLCNFCRIGLHIAKYCMDGIFANWVVDMSNVKSLYCGADEISVEVYKMKSKACVTTGSADHRWRSNC